MEDTVKKQKNLIFEGDSNLENGKIQEAMTFYIQSLKQDAGGYQRFCLRGNLFQELGNNDKAISEFQRTYQFKKYEDVAKYLKGICYIWIDNYEGALDIMSETVRQYFNFSYGYQDRGNVYFYMGQNEEAIFDYSSAIKLNSNFAVAYYNRGNAFKGLNKLEEAIEDYTNAIRLNPLNSDAYIDRGIVLANLNNIEEAIQDYSTAIELNPKDAIAFYNRGHALKGLNKLEEAIKDYSMAIQLNPHDADTYYNRGNILQDLNKIEITLLQLSQILCIALKGLNKIEEAIKDYSTVIELSPQDAVAYYNRGNILQDLNKMEEAIKDYSTAIELNPQDAAAYNNRGTALQDINKKEAINDYLKAIELKPQDPVYYSNLGSLYIVQNEHQKAFEMLKKSEELLNSLTEADKISLNINFGDIDFIKEKISLLQQIEIELQKASKFKKQKTLPLKEEKQLDQVIEQFQKEASKEIIKPYKEGDNLEALQKQVQKLQQMMVQLSNAVAQQNQVIKQQQIELQEIKNLDTNKIEFELRELQFNQNQFRYYQSFYWRLFNYLSACQHLSTGLFQTNNNAVIDSTAEQLAQYANEGLKIGATVTGSIPMVGSVFQILSASINFGFTGYKDRKLSKRIQNLSSLVRIKSTNLDNDVKKAGIHLAKQLNNNHLDQQLSQDSNFSNYRNQINEEEVKQKLTNAKDPYWQLGIEHSLFVLIHLESQFEFYQNDKELKFNDIIIDAAQKKLQEKQKSNQQAPQAQKCCPCCMIQ